jgi:hypothetical protein
VPFSVLCRCDSPAHIAGLNCAVISHAPHNPDLLQRSRCNKVAANITKPVLPPMDDPPTYAEVAAGQDDRTSQPKSEAEAPRRAWIGNVIRSATSLPTVLCSMLSLQPKDLPANEHIDSDLSTYTHHQDLLVAVSSRPGRPEAQPASALLSWTKEVLTGACPPELLLVSAGRVGVEQLLLLRGSRLTLSTRPDAQGSTLMANLPLTTMDRLRDALIPGSPMPGAEAGYNIELASIPVRLHAIDEESRELFAPGARLLWKWAKPESVYAQKSGYWETPLHAALEEGEWNAGRRLYLLCHALAPGEKWDVSGRRSKIVIFS